MSPTEPRFHREQSKINGISPRLESPDNRKVVVTQAKAEKKAPRDRPSGLDRAGLFDVPARLQPPPEPCKVLLHANRARKNLTKINRNLILICHDCVNLSCHFRCMLPLLTSVLIWLLFMAVSGHPPLSPG